MKVRGRIIRRVVVNIPFYQLIVRMICINKIQYRNSEWEE